MFAGERDVVFTFAAEVDDVIPGVRTVLSKWLHVDTEAAPASVVIGEVPERSIAETRFTCGS